MNRNFKETSFLGQFTQMVRRSYEKGMKSAARQNEASTIRMFIKAVQERQEQGQSLDTDVIAHWLKLTWEILPESVCQIDVGNKEIFSRKVNVPAGQEAHFDLGDLIARARYLDGQAQRIIGRRY